MPDDITHFNGSQAHQDNDETADRPTRRVGRRKMLLGVAAAGVGTSVVVAAEPAGAESPDTGAPKVKLSKLNTATATTSVSMSVDGDSGVEGIDTSSGGGYGLYGSSANGTGIYGTITGDTSGHFALQGVDASTGAGGGAGVGGNSTNGTGVLGISTNATGVYGIHSTGAGTGVSGVDDSGETSSHGVYGSSGNGCGVYGTTPGESAYGVYGNATGKEAYGVYGGASGGDGTGVYGTSDSGSGVYGNSIGGIGVYGVATAEYGAGVSGVAPGDNGNGVVASAQNGVSLYVDGSAQVTGTLSKGGGTFKIDHPLDPTGKYLFHSFVESPDMMNVYNGTIALDGNGRATVELPEWFEALNRDYRYQLTPIGGAAPELHISEEVNGGTFAIAGGKDGQKVSWQVTGIRQDAWANANRVRVEVDKPAEDRGRYLHPELFGGEPVTELSRVRDHARGHSSTPTASKQGVQS
ncbi:MAG: hypothetical protein WAM97_18180 [Acidimicrobiales bacterium]